MLEITAERKIELFKIQEIWDGIYIPPKIEEKSKVDDVVHGHLPERKNKVVRKNKNWPKRFSKKAIKERGKSKVYYWSNPAYRIRNKSILPPRLPRRAKCTLY